MAKYAPDTDPANILRIDETLTVDLDTGAQIVTGRATTVLNRSVEIARLQARRAVLEGQIALVDAEIAVIAATTTKA